MPLTPNPSRREVRQADLALLLAVAVWGSSFAMVKDMLAILSPAGIVGLRFALASLLMMAIALAAGGRKTLFRCLWPGLLLGACLGVVFVSQTVGMMYTRASNSAFITGMFVVFTPLWAWLVARVPPRWSDAVLGLLAVTGMALLSLQFSGPEKFQVNRGDAITLFTALAQALHIAFTHKYVRRSLDPFALLFFQFLVVAGVSFASAPFYAHGLGQLHLMGPVHWLAIVYLAIFPASLTYLIQALTQKFTEPMHLSLIFALEPVFASLFAVYFLLERFTPQQITGAVILLLTCVMSEWIAGKTRPGHKKTGAD